MPAGFGAPQAQSIEASALKQIDSSTKTFVNKDFVKNISWLNQSVDTLSAYTQKLQQGVDSANQNVIEQIQGIFADLFVLIGGGEPTGIEIGDIKYIFQAIGALFGINPDTPFPLNLIEAVGHMFEQFIIPLPQFTDVIFDAMAAWAEDLGFSDAAVDAITEFSDAVVRWFQDFQDVLGIVGDFFASILKMLGLGGGLCGGTGVLGSLWDTVFGFINNIIEGPKQLLLAVLSEIIVVIFKIMTFVVNATNPMGLMSMFGMNSIGPQLAPEISGATTVWNCGSNPNTSWVFDATVTHGSSEGSFKTNGTGTNKRVYSQTIQSCIPGDEYTVSGWVKWDQIPSDRSTFGPCIIFYAGSQEVSQMNINAPSTHGASGGWAQFSQTLAIPQNCNGFRIGARVSNEITSGIVRVDDLSITKQTFELCAGGIVGVFTRFFSNMIKGAVIGVEQLFGWIPEMLFGWIPIGHLSDTQPNLWPQGLFPANSLAGNSDWSLDADVTKSAGTGSAKVTANGKNKAMRGIGIPVTSGQKLALSIFARWTGFSGGALAGDINPIQLQLVTFKKQSDNTYKETGTITVASINPAGPTNGWTEMAATYAVPAGVDEIKPRLFITEGALAGTIWFDEATCKQAGKIQQSWVDGLADAFSDVIGRWQLLINTIFKAFTGQDSLTTKIEDLFLALLNIPFGNILGVNGPSNIGQTIIDFLDNLIGGFVGKHGSGAGFADLFNIANIISGWANLGNMAWEILGLRNNTPVYTGLLPNGKSNYPITGINANLAATQASSLIATFRINESSPLGVVSWLGYGTTNITAFYVNIWKIDSSTGDWSLSHHSLDIKAELHSGTTPQWHFYEIPEPLATVAGEEYGIELAPVGSGTHTVRGYALNDTIPDHPYAKVVRLCATRDNTTNPDSPTTPIAKTSVTASQKVPWIELAIDTGNAPGYHDPVTVYMTENGTVPIPEWAGYIECIAIGGGGGGHAGATFGFYGEGGHAGKWNAIRWERGVHFDHNTHVVIFTRGAGGAGGSGLPIIGGFLGGPGGNGGTSKLEIVTGNTTYTLSALGGDGGKSLRMGGHTKGEGPQNFTFDGQVYTGGVDQNVYCSGGTSPGGGGGGGAWLIGGNGGAGGVGAGWVRFVQGAIPGDAEIPDETPPTAPTVVLDEATYSKITVTATGSTDEE